MKDTNPKKQFGDAKPGLGDVPTLPLYLLGEVMRGGAAKYGPYNWAKDPVSASTYVDAALRHLLAWRDGEDLDPESNLPHLAHVMASMAIVLDAQAGGKLVDDRRSPAKPIGEWLQERGGKRSDAMSARDMLDAFVGKYSDEAECDPQWGGATEAPMQQGIRKFKVGDKVMRRPGKFLPSATMEVVEVCGDRKAYRLQWTENGKHTTTLTAHETDISLVERA